MSECSSVQHRQDWIQGRGRLGCWCSPAHRYFYEFIDNKFHGYGSKGARELVTRGLQEMQKLIFTTFMGRCCRGGAALWKFYAFPSFQFGQFSRWGSKKRKCFNHSDSAISCSTSSVKKCQRHIWEVKLGSLKEVVMSCPVTDLRCWFSSFWERSIKGDTLDWTLSSVQICNWNPC